MDAPIEDMIDLLTLELQHYSPTRSKVPMVMAYKQLSEIADPFLLAKVTAQIGQEGALAIYVIFPELLFDIILKFKASIGESCDYEKQVYLANMCFLTYKSKYLAIGRTSHPISPLQAADNLEAFRDPHGEYNIGAVYENLNIDRNNEVMKCLNESLEVLSCLRNGNFKLDSFGDFEPVKIYRLIRDIANEFRQRGMKLPYLRAWDLALVVAEMLQEKILILECITFLIKSSDVYEAYVQSLMDMGDALVNEIDCGKNENLKAAILYYISKGMSYAYEDVPLACQCYSIAESNFRKLQGQDDILLKAQLYLLHSELIGSPCEFNVEGHEEFSIVKIHKAVFLARNFMKLKTGKEECYVVIIARFIK